MAQWTTTYAGLVALIEDMCEDESTELSTNIQGIINRAEDRCLRDLDVQYFEDWRSTSTAAGTDTVAKSSDMVSILSIRLTAAQEFVLPRNRDLVQMYGGSGRPVYYYDDDANIYLAPTPDDSYAIEIKYQGAPQALSPSNTSNWLTTNAATLLLNAALVEAEGLLIDPGRKAEFEAAYAQALGPLRALYRDEPASNYTPLQPAAGPERTR
jgi:hypothetical protein